ncbi:4-hydroxy-3-methylbut-2-enyl diphosphate reductase [uncultured Treponema sp.]|uniref:4-hydroxy-3-methylbut-2-enyl diphosphate reductase n=1 Tax=uncultured Treponema sp. TaxID=162155 RepID=UPI0025FD9C6B|nr:4-hydroxy-3-methylbut-2-enyl diphosphate reductase [uncultured Treponema sp.]
MKVIRAEILGFCAGVRRAVLTAQKALDERGSSQVYTLGPLIHNPVALKKLAERNLKVLSESEIPSIKENDIVLIRAHGVPPEIEEKLSERGAKVLNATCPLVTKSQKTAAEYAHNGYVIFFAGDKNHGEVVGIEGYARKAAKNAGLDLNFLLVKNENELEETIKNLSHKNILNTDSKVALLSQTTFSIKTFDEMQSALEKHFPEAKIINSICPATHERQDSLVNLCSKVDGVIVIGGKNSANTNRLYKTAADLCKKAVLIETPDEIPEDFLNLDTIGITAGASTPDDTIDAVEEKLRGVNNSRD